MTQSSCISACLACVFHNTTLVFCIRHPPNLFSEGWTDISVTLCALLKHCPCPTASHCSADTQPSHLSWLTMVVSHSFFLIIPQSLCCDWNVSPGEWSLLLRGSVLTCQPLQQDQLLPPEFPPPGHFHQLQIPPQTLQWSTSPGVQGVRLQMHSSTILLHLWLLRVLV